MNLNAAKNKLTGIDSTLCTLRGWWNGEVGKVMDAGGNGCDAIICPTKSYNDYGRAISGKDGECLSCSNGPYAGATTCAGVTEPDQNLEKTILDKLWVATGGKNWTKGQNWADGPVCDYEGITCSAPGVNVNEGVEVINVTGFGLINTIPTEIWQLPSLKKVDFSRNVVDLGFGGIGQAKNLEEINIDDADLTSVKGISDAPALKKVSADSLL